MATGLSSSSVVVCSGSHVVWSWLNELNISIPFPPDTSYEIERQYYQLRVTTCTLSSGLVVNFTNMTYKRKRGSSSRAIFRQNISLPSTEVNAYWEWDSGGGTFLPYAVIASVDIETAYLRRSPSLDLSTSTSKLPYSIDFKKMTQCRHGYGTIRAIRRIQLIYSLQRYLQDLSKSSVLPSNSYTTPAASVLTNTKVSKSSSKTTPHSTSTKSRGTSSSSTSSSSSSSTPSAPVSSSTRGSTVEGLQLKCLEL